MFNTFAFLDLGAPQLLIILGIVILLFGSRKLPDLARSLGESVQELKKGASSATDLKQDIQKQAKDIKTELTGSDKPGEQAARKDQR